MKASVIICSRNRADSLLETLQSLVDMEMPAGTSLQVVVVDNASQDGTAERVREWSTHVDTPVDVLVEPQPGKAFALNRGLASAHGDVFLFTDDDALMDRRWLRATLDAFVTSGADCVGGRVRPLWLGSRPDWLTDRLLNVLAMLDLGPEPRELDRELLYGVNYAFRRETFERLGGFDTKLCARGCGNEDREMIERLRAAGGRVYYDPAIQVHHKVFPERLTRAYFRRWYRLNGRDRAETVLTGARSILGLEGYLLRDFGRVVFRYLYAALKSDANDRFYQELQARLYLAYIRARIQQYFERRVPVPRGAVTGSTL